MIFSMLKVRKQSWKTLKKDSTKADLHEALLSNRPKIRFNSCRRCCSGSPVFGKGFNNIAEIVRFVGKGSPNVPGKINTLKDLRDMDPAEMNQLAVRFANTLLRYLQNRAISPNLGVVELTIALHYVFNT